MKGENWIIENHNTIRLSLFVLIFLLVTTWENIRPFRQLLINKTNRWFHNLLLVFINNLFLRLLFPTTAIGFALFIQQNQWGLFHNIDINTFTKTVIAILVLDLIIYVQHRLVHSVPLLWKLHRVHHCDLDFDVTTGIRFHPLEIVFSMLIKLLAIALIGAPVLAVIIFEVLLNATSLFNHANFTFSNKVDGILRLVIVTPDMHRIHHSDAMKETNSNYGFSLTWWDKIFNTYKKDAEKGQLGLTIGLKEFKKPKITNQIKEMLLIPFKK